MDAHEVPKLDRNIAAVKKAEANSEHDRGADHRFIDLVANFAGSRYSLYLHFLIYGGWIYALSRGDFFRKLGDSGEHLSLALALEAIFLSVFVLINQKRTNILEKKNADLHLQMSLLSEHEITRVAQMVDLIAKRLSIDMSAIGHLEEVKREVDPTEIIEKISFLEEDSKTPTGDPSLKIK